MDTDTTTPQPQTPQQAPPQSPYQAAPAPRSGNIGPLAAAVVIVLLVAAGGLYFFWAEQQRQEAIDAQLQTAGEQAPPMSNSTESIEADLEATETGGASTDVDNLNNSL